MAEAPAHRDPWLTVWLPRAVIVLGALATVAGLVLVDRLGDRYRTALEIAVDAADVAVAAADPVTGLPAAVAEVADAVSASLTEVRTVALTAAAVTDDLSAAARTNLAETVRGTSQIANRLADFVELVERFIPGDEASLAEDLRTLSDGLEPVPAQLEALAGRLEEGAGNLTDTAVTLGILESRLDEVAAQLGDAATAVEDLPAVATRLRAEAERARDEIDDDLWLLRLLVVLTGATAMALGAAVEVQRRSTARAVALVLSATDGA